MSTWLVIDTRPPLQLYELRDYETEDYAEKLIGGKVLARATTREEAHKIASELEKEKREMRTPKTSPNPPMIS